MPTKGATRPRPVPEAPCLPRRTKEDVGKCHACHAKWCGVTGDQRRPSATRPIPVPQVPHARRNEGGCRQVPRLPRWPRETKEDVVKCHCHKRHACHAKRKLMSPSAAPATQSAGGCRHMSRLPRKDGVCVCDKVVCDKVVRDKVVCV